MLAPATGEEGLRRIEAALLSAPKRAPIAEPPPPLPRPERLMSIREAVLAPQKRVPLEKALGRVVGSDHCGCPPAVPIVTAGERIDEAALACMKYYGFTHCFVLE